MSKLVDKERLAKLAQGLYSKLHLEIGEADAQVLKDAKEYTDGKITEVNNSAIELGKKVTALEEFKTTQEKNNTTQLEAINARVEKTVYDAKMALLDAEDEKITGLVAAEAKSREDADKALDERVKPLETHVAAQPAIDAEQDRRLGVLEADAPVKQAAIEAAQKAADDAQAAAEAAQADANTLEQRLDAEGGLVDRIEANESAIGVLNGDENQVGSVAKQIKDAIDEVNSAASDLEDRVKANEEFVAGYAAKEEKIREDFAAVDATIRAEFAAADAAEVTRVNKKIADDIATESALRVAEEARIEREYKAAIAQEVIDRNAAIAVEKQRAEEQEAAIRGEFETADNALKAALQKEIDDDVAVVANALANEKKADVEGTLANQIKVEKERMDAFLKDADVQQGAVDTLKELQNYIDTHGQAAQKMVDDIAANTGNISKNAEAIAKLNGAETVAGSVAYAVKAEETRALAAEKANADAITALDERIEELEEVTSAEGILAQAKQFAKDQDAALKTELQKEIDDDVKAEANLRVAADNLLDERIKVFEANGAQDVAAKEVRLAAAEGEIDALQAFVETHDHTVIEQRIADNKAAIEAEVGKEGVQGNRDKAIATALEAYSTTTEMKQIIGNVVNSLALTMEDDQVVLKLGGVDGIALTSVDLDLATDAEIEAILAGLK